MKTVYIGMIFIEDVFSECFIYLKTFDCRDLMVTQGKPALQDYLEFLEMM